MYQLIYEDERIKLRRATKADSKAFHDILNDQDVMIYYGESPTSMEYVLKEIEWFNKLFDENGGRWVIEDKAS